MRAVLALVVLACLAAGAWLAFDPTDAPSLPGATDAPGTSHASTAAALAAPAAAPTPEVPSAPRAVDAGAAQRKAATPAFTGPAGEVQVVRFDTRAPIADATVYCWPPDFDWRQMTPELQELARKDNDALLQRIGLQFATDAEGCCRVPLGKMGTSVTAVKDELWGQGHLGKDVTERTVVAVRVDRTLHVRVVDAIGKPAAGASVLGRRAGGGRPMSWQIGATDAAGRLDHRHLQTLAGEDAATKTEIVASAAGCESSPALVDVTAPPSEVLLQLPPGGAVTVRVLDTEGRPIDPTYLGEPSVSLATFVEKPSSENAITDGMNRGQNRAPIDARGEAVFGPVGFDHFVVASAGWWMRSAVVRGPTLETPRVEITVREGADDIVLAGTLLDADGRPMATSSYSGACKYRGGMSGLGGRTDASGRFRLAVPRLPAGQQVAVSFDTMLDNAADPQALELPPRELAKGRNDLGEVRLARHTLLVAGKVVMAEGGEPVPVQIQIERKDDARWQQEWNLHPTWGEQGAFTMRSGIAKGTPIRLVVQTTGYLPVPPIECAAGDTGIEIKLQKGGSARATFLVDDAMPLDRLTFRFRRSDAPAERDARAEMMERIIMSDPAQAKDGRVEREWSGLKAGRYRLQVLCVGVAEPIVAIDAVEIADGPCADPRLVDVDLRGRVRSFEIRATSSNGSPIADRGAFVVIRSSGDDWNGFHLASGVVKIAAPAAVDLIVIAKGHKAAFVSGVSDTRTVALEAAPDVRVAVTLPSPLPEGATLKLLLKPSLDLPRRARVQLDTGRGMQAENFFVEEAIVDAAGVAIAPVRFPGTYALEATVALGRRGGTYIRDLDPRTIALPAAGDVAVKIGQKGFDQALESARR